MLYLVLGLVLAAFGLLIAALATANTLFAWISVTVSVIAAGLLVLDWLRGRRRAADAAEAAEPDPVLARPEQPFGDQTPPLTETVRNGPSRVEPAGQSRTEAGRTEPPGGGPELVGAEPPAILADRTVSQPADRPTGSDRPAEPPGEPPARQPAEPPEQPPEEPPARQAVAEEPGEPGEEPTDATDLLVVSDLRVEVRVVDEHPRYHLASCTYLLDKPTLPLPVAEARQLGFTPCARCGPDATLAAQHRATR